MFFILHNLSLSRYGFILQYGLLGIFYEFIEHPFRVLANYPISYAYQCIKNHFNIIHGTHLVNISGFKYPTGLKLFLPVLLFISNIVTINKVI